jgi:integrase
LAASRVVNQQSFHDGKLVLYQLENRPKHLWLCRIKVPNGTGYIYRGTGTSDLYGARKFAEDLLDEIRIKTKLGQSITGPNFAKMVEDFETHSKAKGESTKRDLAIIAFLKAYAVSYFTKNKVTDVSAKEIAKFFDWRRANSKRKAPKETTILHETSQFTTFLRWCSSRGHLDREIRIERPKQDGARRPHFNAADWRKLTRFIREWVKQGEHKSGPIYRDRVMLTNYVLILANTGIRVGEARGLQWRDVESEPASDSSEVDIIVHVKGKTGLREVVARTPEVQTYFHRIWVLRCKELSGVKPSKDDFVFCHTDGKPIHSFKKGFMTLISEAGVEKDREGERRTIYSLRHTYATFRLQEGVNHFVLARNMGTSVKMLEQFYGHTSNRAMASELTKSRAKEKKKLPWE